MSLDGRIAIVTGAGGGLGRAHALYLASKGARVVVNDLSEEAAQRVAAEIGALGGKALAFAGSVTDEWAVTNIVASTMDAWGRVDILVNNAGIQHVAPVEQFPVERWDAIIAINLSSAFHTTRLALPGMRERNWGRIINVASVHGLVGSEQKAAYVAAKHGLVGLTKVVALETATTPITCNAICPGWVLTPLVQQQIDERARESGDEQRARHDLLAEKQPSLDFVTPAQLGAMALFLCSEAGDQVRGAAWNMDGGWAAR